MTIVEQIVSREIEAIIVYESESVIAFADHDPINFGHIIICPVQPYQSFIDLPSEVHSEIQTVAHDLYGRIKNLFKPDGISFMQNDGKFNELNHYHLHIFPRFEDDGFGWTCSEMGIQTQEVLRESLTRL